MIREGRIREGRTGDGTVLNTVSVPSAVLMPMRRASSKQSGWVMIILLSETKDQLRNVNRVFQVFYQVNMLLKHYVKPGLSGISGQHEVTDGKPLAKKVFCGN